MRGVSQISLPIRIVVAVAAVFLVAWMTVLKPKSTEDLSAPAPITTGNVATGKPAVSAPGKLAEKAKSAVANANQKQSAAMGETAGSTTKTAPAAGSATTTQPSAPAAKPAAKPDALAGVPTRVANAIRKQKVVVLGFFGAKAADDRDVRKAMFKADRWDGRVFVTSASINKVSKWGRIARGVDVQQSPTVVVIGTDLKATPLVGYVDTRSINQAVVDSLHNTGGLFTNATTRGINRACATAASALYATPSPSSRREALRTSKRVSARLHTFVGDLRAITASTPARKALKRATVADAVALRGGWLKFDRAIQGRPSLATLNAMVDALANSVAPAEKSLNKRARHHHLLSCEEV
jgi:hypothetical protein